MALSPAEPMPRRCPRCSATFQCGLHQPMTDPCWCAGLDVDVDVLARLAVGFEGCLCGDCLRSAQA